MLTFITELNNTNYDEFVKSGVVLVDIYAEWCGPCKLIAPIVDELSIDYKDQIKVGKIDADQNSDIVSKLNIRNIPTVLIFKDGEVVDKVVGLSTKSKLSELIDTHLYKIF